MKIVFTSSEVTPFAKTGGLGDVVGALPKALAKVGVECFIILPKYKCVDAEKFKLVKSEKRIVVHMAGRHVDAEIFTTTLYGNIPVYFVGNVDYFDRDGIYEAEGEPFHDNAERFGFFSKVCLKLLKEFDIRCDIIHCNDWQTGLIPLYLKRIRPNDCFFYKTRTIFTIHNIAYQGVFEADNLDLLGIPHDVFSTEGVEFYGKINLLKSGLVFSDIITTVSMTYAKEIQTEVYGCGLDGLLRKRTESLVGIINGIDDDEWNPLKDEIIAEQYSANNLSGKKTCKRDIMGIFGLECNEDIPLVGIISRLDEQKGFDLIEEVIDDLMKMNIKLCLLGLGRPKYHEFLERTETKYREKFSIRLAFDNTIAHKIEAGVDIFFMPSRYEPCGMNQLYSLKYGTIPVVRNTGGLADTIKEYDPVSKKGNGFKFSGYTGEEFLNSVYDAVNLYQNKEEWKVLVKNAMGYDYSWDKSANEYMKLYQKLKDEAW